MDLPRIRKTAAEWKSDGLFVWSSRLVGSYLNINETLHVVFEKSANLTGG
jgi:hypothetical protein